MKVKLLTLLSILILIQPQAAYAGFWSTFFGNIASDAVSGSSGYKARLLKEKKVQGALAMMGYYQGKADGDLNNLDSRLAIKAFQRDAGQEETGILSDVEIQQLLYLSNLYISLKKTGVTLEKRLLIYDEIDTTVDSMTKTSLWNKVLAYFDTDLKIIVDSDEAEGAQVLVNGTESGSIEFGYYITNAEKGDQIEIYKATADGEWQLTGSQVVVDTDSVVVAIEKKPSQARTARIQRQEKERIARIQKRELDKRYRKIAADGTVLDINAPRWSCVLDTQTQLVWEVKTDDGGLHDKDKTYRWGGKGVSQTALGEYLGNNRLKEFPYDGGGRGRNDDWDTLVDGTNQEQLCGYTDWRVPDLYELASLVYCGEGNEGEYDIDDGCGGDFEVPFPAGHTDLFPYLVGEFYWSSSSFKRPDWSYSPSAWQINYYLGYTTYKKRWFWGLVRLVHGGQ